MESEKKRKIKKGFSIATDVALAVLAGLSLIQALFSVIPFDAEIVETARLIFFALTVVSALIFVSKFTITKTSAAIKTSTWKLENIH